MANFTVAFSNLNNFLKSLPENTKHDPYKLNITGLVAADCGDSSTLGTLGYILNQNPTKYVDLNRTTLPSDLTSMYYAFYNCATLVVPPIIPSTVTNMSYAFAYCYSLTNEALANFVIPKGVTDLSSAFRACSLLTDLSDLIIPYGVSNMSNTFNQCSALVKAPDIPSTVYNFSYTFSNCKLLKSIYIKREDFTNVNVQYLFLNCNAIQDITLNSDAAKTSLSGKLRSYYDYPSSKNLNTIIKIIESVSISNLNTYLQGKAVNTADTAYRIRVTDLTTSNCGPAYSSGNLGYIIGQNSTKYVDLSPTELPSGLTSLSYIFDDCSNLVKSPILPSTATSLSYAYRSCSALKVAPVIPNGVFGLGYAFGLCTSLTTLPTIPSSVTNMSEAFIGCSGITDVSELILPSGLLDLQGTFAGCTGIVDASKLVIPNTVTNMREMFSNCTSLTKAPKLSTSVTNLVLTFYQCPSLTDIPEIPASVTNLDETFWNCSSLKDVILNISDYTNVTAVSYLFSGCTSLENVYVTDSTAKTTLINKLTADSSSWPSSLDKDTVIKITNIPISDLNTYLQGKAENTASTPYKIRVTGLTTSNCGSAWTSGNFGYILKQNSTKYVDLSLTELPSGLTDIRSSFDNCSSLVYPPKLPEGILYMNSTFSGCESLKVLPEIPSTVTNMNNTFRGCDSITDISYFVIPYGVIAIGDTASDGSYTPDSEITSTRGLFRNCANIVDASKLIIPDTVRDMGEVFFGCRALKKAPSVPDGVTSLYNTFRNTSITVTPYIPDSVTNMGFAFDGCISLTKVTNLPSGITKLNRVFRYCSGLATIPNIPSTVTELGETFYQCPGLKNVAIEISDYTNITVTKLFTNCNALEDVYVPSAAAKSSLSNKLTTDDFPSILDKDEVIKIFHIVAFADLNTYLQGLDPNTPSTPYKIKVTGLTSSNCGYSGTSGNLGYVLQQNSTKYVDLSYTELPSGTTSLYSTFQNCTSLTAAPIIPNSVTNMKTIFSGCTNLVDISSVTIPYGVTSLMSAFAATAITDASKLKISTDPEKLVELSNMFANCTSLEKGPTVPANGGDISAMFSGCTSLTTLKYNITDYTDRTTYSIFYNCISLKNIYVPSADAKTALISKLSGNSNFPSTLDKNTVIKVYYSTTFADLNSLLQSLDPNTYLTPYPIDIIDLEKANCGYSTTSGTLGYVLNQNTKSVDLSLTELPSSLTSMAQTFYNCTALSVPPEIPDGVSNLYQTFYNCSGLIDISNLVIPSGVTSLGSTFYNCYSLPDASSLVIPNSVTSLDNAFYNCSNLTSAPEIPNSVTNLSYAFYHCSKLVNFPQIPNRVTNLSYAFNSCTKLDTTLVVPNTATNLNYAFRSSSLKKVFIDISNFTNITTTQVFSSCSELEDVYVPSAAAKTALISKLGNNDFPSTLDKNTVIKVGRVTTLADLNTVLQGLDANTTSTPYAIKVIDLTSADLGSSSTSGALGYILNQNPTKYVDLRETELPDGVTDLTNAFKDCSSLIYSPSVPDGVTDLTNAFSGCTNLKSATLDIADYTSVTTDGVFYNCTSLESVYVDSQAAETALINKLTQPDDFPSTLDKSKIIKKVYTVTLANLYSLLQSLDANTVSTPYKLNIIGTTTSDYYSYTNLSKSPIASRLTQNPTKYVDLRETTLPRGLTNMQLAFYECTTLVYSPPLINSITRLSSVFWGCTSLAEFPQIPSSVIYMSDTFRNCSSAVDASELVIPSGVTSLESTFINCTSLTTPPTIPNNVTNLSYTFSGCTSLTTLPVIPSSVTNIVGMLSYCTQLVDVSDYTIPSTATTLNFLFRDCTSLTTPPEIPNTATNLNGIFENCTSLTDLSDYTIPDSVTSLNYTFNGCTSLTKSPIIPDSVTSLNYTFSGCTSLQKTTIDVEDYTNVTVDHAFEDCTSLQSIYVPTATAKTTLSNNLTTDDFPSTLDKNIVIKVVYSTTFADLNSLLQSLETNTVSTPYMINIVDLASADLGPSSTSGTLGYILQQNSTKYVDLSEVELPVRIDMSTTFSGCSTLVVSPELPSGVTNINECFSGTSIITPPVIPSSVTNMNATFSSCSRMTSVPNIPDGVTDLKGLLRSCTSLTDSSLVDFEIPDGVTSIGASAEGPSYFSTYGLFRSDVQLVDLSGLEIPSSVLDAGEAFLGCVSLKYAPTIPDTITFLSKTFYNCTSLETVILEGEDFSSKNIEGIFHDCTSLKNVCVSSEAAKTFLIEELTSFDFPASLDKKKVIKVGNPCTLAELDDYLKSLDPNTVSTPYKIIITDLASIDLGSSSNEGTLGYILNQNPTKYVDLSINDLPNDLITLENSFKNCTTLIKVPTITEDIEDLTNAFYGCSNIKNITLDIEDYSDVDVDGAFYGCTSLQTIFVPSEAAKTSLSSELTNADFPSTLDKDVVIKYGLTCSFSGLNDFLQSLEINTADEPYQIVVTDLTAADLGSSDNTGTLGYVLKNNPSKYVDLTYTILPNNLTSLEESFKNCSNLVVPPIIPNTVTDMTGTFKNCTSLIDFYGFEIPDGVITLEETFSGCTNLTNVYGFNIPDSVTNLSYAFENCTSLIDPPNIPDSVTNMAYTFSGCTSLEEAPEIPDNVVIMNGTFKNCSSLTEAPEIPDGVINLSSTFESCSSLVNAPSISSEVVNLNKVFYNCSSLENITLEGEDFSRVNLTEAFCGCVSVERIIVCSADAKNSLINNLSSDDYPDIWELNDMIKIQTIETLEKEVASSVPITEMIIVNQDQTVNPKMGSSIVINGNSAVLVTLGSSNVETCRVPVLSNNNDAYVLYYNALGEKVYDRIYSQYSVSYIYLGEIEVNNNTVSVWMPETGTSYRLNGDQTTQLYDGLPNDYKQYRGNGIYNYYYDTLVGSRIIYDLPDINLCVKISWGNAFTASVVAEQWYQDPAQSLDAGIIWTRSKWESGSHNWFPWVENNGDAAPATLTNKTIDGLNNILKISPTVISATPSSALVPTKKMIIVIDTANVTLSIGNGPYVGYILPIFATASCTVSYTGSGGSTSETLANKQRIDLIWNGSEWTYEKIVLMEGTYRDNTAFAFNVVTRG